MRKLLIAMALVAVVHAQTQEPSYPREAEDPNAPKPSAPSMLASRLIGEFQSPSGHLIVFERDGKLWTTLDRREPKLLSEFAFTPKDSVTTVLLIDNVTYRRQDVGPTAGGQLKVTPIRNVVEVLKESLTVNPPKETGDFKSADLVELARVDSSIKLDIRYATTNNFLGSVFYSEARAFLQRPAAESVLRAQQALKPLGYGLLIHDGYRPWYVTRTFYECTPAEKKWLVANPASGSKHNRGAAVDLTLYDLKTGAVIEMPSTYDESTSRAYAFYPGGTSLQRWHRALLRRVMEAEGFTVNPEEWWHFDFKDWKSYAIGNVVFDKIK